VNGIQVPFYTQKSGFYSMWPNYVQSLTPAVVANGGSTYTVTLPYFPATPGHVDMTGVIDAVGTVGSLYATNNDPFFLSSADIVAAIPTIPVTSMQSAVFFVATDINGQNVTVGDTGLFLQAGASSQLYGALASIGKAPLGNAPLAGGYSITSNTINYSTGVANVTFPSNIPAGNSITAQCHYFQPGLPRGILFYDNVLTLRNPPDRQYLVSLEGYLTPAAFLSSSSAVPFAYMAEYIARGAARKVLADTGDMEQFNFYEPLFKEQELLVWKRSQRQFTSTRTPTIFSEGGIGSVPPNTSQGGMT
jgi:hypothetical protein